MRVFVLLLCLCTLCAPITAQEITPIPLDVALNTTPIPPRDRIDLARRLNGVTDIPDAPTSAPLGAVGEQAQFFVSNTSDEEMVQITATLQVVGDHIYLWVENDLDTPLDLAELTNLADAFDLEIYDIVRELWGSEANPGIDGDARVYALFTDDVGAGAAAYYMGDNVYPRAVLATSNQHDMFYFNADVFGRYPALAIESVVAHEFQHMIRRNLQINEETWMNEGFSTFTETLLYAPDTETIYSFLLDPNMQLNSWNENQSARGANYGAANLFITYFYERYGIIATRQLSEDNAPRGLQAVDNVLREIGEPGVDVLFADWVVANRVLDANTADGRYGYDLIDLNFNDLMYDENDTYPMTLTGIVAQYGTQYTELIDPPDILTLDIKMPTTVGVVPTSAPSGTRFWYSNRADMSDMTLTRAFDLTGVTTATLTFNVWHHFETLWDFGHVMVSIDDGATWQILQSRLMTTDNPYNTAYGAGYTGVSGGDGSVPAWAADAISLDAYVGQQILLRFEAISDDAINQPGMVIDDIEIAEIGYESDFENDDGGWQANGFIWTNNSMPQRAWVQIIERKNGDVRVTRWLIPDDGTQFMIDLESEFVTLAISGIAPVTTVPMPYQITLASQ